MGLLDAAPDPHADADAEATAAGRDEAMARRELEGVILFGIQAFRSIVRVHDAWRGRILEGRIPYDEALRPKEESKS